LNRDLWKTILERTKTHVQFCSVYQKEEVDWLPVPVTAVYLGVVLRPLVCWYCGLESRRGHYVSRECCALSGRCGQRPLGSWDCGFESRRGIYLCLWWVLCVVRYRSLRLADHMSRGVIPSMLCLRGIVKPQYRGGSDTLGTVAT
jgi:hypothetical protein